MKGRTAVLALFLGLLLVITMTLAQGSLDETGRLLPIPASGWVDTSTWATYVDVKHDFKINYPQDFIATAETVCESSASEAVVTFVPTFDPSIDRTGAKTNLFAFSVTISVREGLPPLSEQGEWCNCGRRLEGLYETNGVRFVRCYFAEGAAGNQYSEFSYRTTCEGVRYEIALFAHFGNPGCYVPGTVVIIDESELLHLFDAMVGTFSTHKNVCRGSD
jgi:hypothetical protein